MTATSLVKLVSSLSRSEKRYFKLQSQTQGGEKRYLVLFDLIDREKNPDPVKLKQAFKKRSPKASWENACIYLGEMLADSLVRSKTEKDVFFELLHEIQKIKVLKERSLEQEALKQLKKVQQKASKFQIPLIEYLCCRLELNYYSDRNFSDVKDDELVKIQMKGKGFLRSLNQIHDHYSLYELLRYRLVHAGKIFSEGDKKKLNDLMLSEMVLVAGKSNNFSSQKLHLLFQSYFFTDISDYVAALKSFHQLNDLMEKNEAFLDNPPFDYLAALVGIMESLRVLQQLDEVPYYIAKLQKLDQNRYPEFFRYLVKKVVSTQQMITLLQSGSFNEAKQYLDKIPGDIFDHYTIIDKEKQGELCFYSSLVNYGIGDLQKAHLYIREIMNQVKLPPHLVITKAIRLLNIIIYYEKGELTHLEYETRSYKRFFIQSGLLRIEKKIFQIIDSSAANKRIKLLPAQLRRILNELDLIEQDRYEQQLLKYFDFSGWIRLLLKIPAAKGL